DHFDAGATVRSFGSLTELSAQARYELLSEGRIALGVEGSAGFGFGPTSTADFFLEGAGIATANRIDPLSATLRISGQLFADSSSRPEYVARTGSDSQAVARLSIGLGLAYHLSKDLSIEGIMEAAPAQSPRHM